jgi:hypothetical protein
MGNIDKDYPRMDIAARLHDLPAADVRPVTMCRDCVNYVESGEANGEKMCVIDADWCAENGCYYGFTVYTPPNWFCADGERKREDS